MNELVHQLMVAVGGFGVIVSAIMYFLNLREGRLGGSLFNCFSGIFCLWLMIRGLLG